MRKRFVVILATVLVLSLSATAFALDIVVTGSGTVSLPADTATLELGASFKAQSAQEAQQLTDTAIKQILAALEKLGVEKKDVTTSNYSVYVEVPYQEYGSIGQAPPVYNASNMLLVTIRDLSKVAAVIDAGTEAGANQIYSLVFSSSQATEAYYQAMEKAVADGQAKAEVLAKAAGKPLGKLESIKSEDMYGEFYGAKSPMAAQEGMGDGTTIVTGEVVVTARVTMTYDLD